MGQSDEQQQEDALSVAGGNLALREATLVADDLVLDASALPAELQPNSGESKPSSYSVELFWDEALVTETELLYGETAYPLTAIESLQILKLRRRRSIIQKKISNFLAGMMAAAGIVLLLGPLAWFIRVLGLLLVSSSIGYAIYFNWWVEQRRRGEFGLLMTMKAEAKVVITSHSLKAIQALYQVLFRRLDAVNPVDESLMVNMYTGEITNNY
ncbi:MAG: hypothetical protein AAGA46_07335 [Cyanobacteria bacterium P01_F01_bin.13]